MKILFQGDSITDACRDRADYHNLAGYTKFTAEILGEGNEYINLGISGDTSAMVLNRYEKDIKAISPDLMTILIGINDVWRRFDNNNYTSPEKFYNQLEQIVLKTKKDLPKTKIILIEPFLLPAEDKKHWRGDLALIADKVREIAVKYCDGFVAMDGLFATEEMFTPWQELSSDGVHPAEKGQKFLAKHLAEEIKRVIG